MSLPKTSRGLSSAITRIRAHLNNERLEYGWLRDGGGLRYDLAMLYYLLGDNRRSAEYMRWFAKNFPDDIEDPLQLLLMALMLHRMGKDGSAMLVKAMLSNLYLLPRALGETQDRLDIWHSSNWDNPEYVDTIPVRVLDAITEHERAWIRELYNREAVAKIRDRCIGIKHDLQFEHVGPRRSALVKELYELKDHVKP